MSEVKDNGKDVAVSEGVTDIEEQNEIGHDIEQTEATTLSGNAMSEYQIQPLVEDGVLKHKQGKSPMDNMSKYYAWMEASGIRLQKIIDEELGKILQKTPNAKVKFMVVNPQDNATHDKDVQTHLFLVLDYDNE